jgi:hypothetical protein
MAKSSTAAPTKKAKLTPIQKAQLARKANAASGTVAAKKPSPIPLFKAPADFSPHFLEVMVRTEADGLLATQIEGTRYIGRYNPDAEDKKKRDLSSYDWRTLMGVQARLSALTYKPTNDKKFPASYKERAAGLKGSMRLPANVSFKILLRANKRKADDTLAIRVVNVWQEVKLKDSGRVKSVELTKLDPVARTFRRAGRFLPAAFTNVQAPPALRRSRKTDVEDDE